MNRHVRRSAFSLLELILVIAIIAILTSLTLPGLTMARGAQLELTTLAYLRSHAAVFQTYTMDWKDRYPAFAVLDASVTYIRLASGEVIEVDIYFASQFHWPAALGDGYYDGNYRSASFRPAEHTLFHGHPGDYPFLYPCTFIADPLYWDMSTRLGVSQYRATGTHEVVYPSKKSLLVSGWTHPSLPFGNSDHRVPMAMTDASVLTRQSSALNPGVRTGDGIFDHGDWPAAMHTLHGVRGFDIP